MQLNIAKEVADLRRMTTNQLRVRYAEVFGEQTQAMNKAWLLKRIAWRLQALAEGDLSERARQRAAELANDADLRMSPPRVVKLEVPKPLRAKGDLLPGTVITRDYKGETLEVKVLQRGFEFEGDVYKSLSAVAKKITGTHTSGNLFFRLNEGGKQ
jgi:hypothetical protein